MSLDLEAVRDFMRVKKTAWERGYRFFHLGDGYSFYDPVVDKKVSGKGLISAKEALLLLATLPPLPPISGYERREKSGGGGVRKRTKRAAKPRAKASEHPAPRIP
jgi:hypothetical protein